MVHRRFYIASVRCELVGLSGEKCVTCVNWKNLLAHEMTAIHLLLLYWLLRCLENVLMLLLVRAIPRFVL